VEWHSTPEQIAHDRRRRKAAEDYADWLIKPFLKEDLFGPTADAERMLREGAAEARRRLGIRRP